MLSRLIVPLLFLRTDVSSYPQIYPTIPISPNLFDEWGLIGGGWVGVWRQAHFKKLLHVILNKFMSLLLCFAFLGISTLHKHKIRIKVFRICDSSPFHVIYIHKPLFFSAFPILNWKNFHIYFHPQIYHPSPKPIPTSRRIAIPPRSIIFVPHETPPSRPRIPSGSWMRA